GEHGRPSGPLKHPGRCNLAETSQRGFASDDKACRQKERENQMGQVSLHRIGSCGWAAGSHPPLEGEVRERSERGGVNAKRQDFSPHPDRLRLAPAAAPPPPRAWRPSLAP